MQKALNFIDLQHQNHFSFKDEKYDELTLKNKKLPIGARLNFNDIITHNFKLEKTLTPQELLVTSELKMYDEIGLDSSKIYKISYITKEASVGDMKLVESFAVDKNALLEKYRQPLQKVKYIDFLAIPFLIFETLYTHKILEKKNDLFISIDADEAFFAFYKDGSYITSKKTLSLSDMVKEAENKNITTSIEALKETLLKKGLLQENYTPQEYDIYDYIQTTFKNFLSKTYNIALHNRNVYGFTKIERIFFSLDNQTIPGFEQMAQSFFEEATCLALNFLAHEKTLALDAITTSYILDKLTSHDQSQNFTILEKKAPFYKSEVGKFMLASAASIMILSSYPLYQQFQLNNINSENKTLNEQLAVLTRTSSKLKKEQKKLEKSIHSKKLEQAKIDSDLHKLQSVASSLLALKSKDSKYTTMLLTINQLLKKYKLSVENVHQVADGAMDFEIYSKEQKRDTIAQFMNALLSAGYQSVTSNEIKLNDDVYKSIITVKK